MLTSPRARAVAVAALLVGLFGLAVWFGSLEPAPELGAYPYNGDVAADYDRYVGQPVVLAGTVVADDPVTVEVLYDGKTRSEEFVVTGLDREVAPGDGLWVFGVPRADGTVRATDAVVTPPEQFGYAHGVSLFAGAWVLARVVRDWRLDREAPGLAPRPASARREPAVQSADAAARPGSEGGQPARAAEEGEDA